MYDLIQFLTRGEIFLYVGLVAAFVAIFLVSLNLLPDPDSLAAIRRLGVDEYLPKESKVLMIRFLRPFIPLILKRVSKAKWLGSREELQKKLIVAGLSSELTPNEFLAMKFITALLFFLVYLGGATALGFKTPPAFIIISLVAGYFYQDLWISMRIKARKTEILMHLPYTIDVLTLSVEAGLDFIAAMTRLIQKTRKNALTEELTQMLKEIRLGTSRADALRNLADRLEIEEISSLATLLIQADQFGAAIGPVLRAQSDQIRTNRFYAAEKAGARASQLVLIPMVLLIFPTIFLVILGPFFIIYSTRGFF